MTDESVKIGIEIAGDMIRFIEAELWNGKVNITNVQQMHLPCPFDYSSIGDATLIPRFAEVIDRACESFNPKSRKARACIDRRLVLKKTIEVDKGFTEDDIRQHIEWELDQLLIAPRDEFNVGFEHIILNTMQSDIIVFVAVRKALIRYLQDIFKKSRLQLESVDVDLFAALRTLAHGYGDTLKGTSALLQFNRSGIGLTVLYDGKYAFSGEVSPVINERDYSTLPSAEVVVPVQTELNRMLQRLQDRLSFPALNRIFIAGDSGDKAIVNDLEHGYPTTAVVSVNSFKNIYRQLNIESQMLIDNHSASFLSCVGMVF